MGWEDQLRSVALPLLRFTVFSANAVLFGLVPVLLLVLRPAFSRLGSEWDAGRKRLSARLEGLVTSALLASGGATALILLLQTALISELGTGEVQGDSFLSVLETSFGQAVGLRLPLLVALAVMLVGRVHRWVLPAAEGSQPHLFWWLTWGALSLALFATTTFSGHSTVASPVRLAEANDMLHQIAGGIWFSGVVLLATLLPDGWIGKEPVARLDLLGPAVTRFSVVAMASIAVVGITGTLNSILHVGALADFWETGYGRTVSLKIFLFLAILGLGAVNHYVVRARLESARAEGRPTSAQRLFRKTIAAELAIALAVMASTGLLVGLSRTKENAPPPSPTTPTAQQFLGRNRAYIEHIQRTENENLRGTENTTGPFPVREEASKRG